MASKIFLGERLAEHKSTAASSKSAIRDHIERSKGHNIDWENVKVLEREPRDFPRKILEAIHIRTLNPKSKKKKKKKSKKKTETKDWN